MEYIKKTQEFSQFCPEKEDAGCNAKAGKIQNLARDIDQFAYTMDIELYKSSVTDRNAQIQTIAADIESGNTKYIQNFLNAAISDGIRKGLPEILQADIPIEESEKVQSIRRARELLDRLAEYKPLAKIEEAEKAQKEKQGGRPSLKERLAQKQAIVAKGGQNQNSSRKNQKEIG